MSEGPPVLDGEDHRLLIGHLEIVDDLESIGVDDLPKRLILSIDPADILPGYPGAEEPPDPGATPV